MRLKMLQVVTIRDGARKSTLRPGDTIDGPEELIRKLLRPGWAEPLDDDVAGAPLREKAAACHAPEFS